MSKVTILDFSTLAVAARAIMRVPRTRRTIQEASSSSRQKTDRFPACIVMLRAMPRWSGASDPPKSTCGERQPYRFVSRARQHPGIPHENLWGGDKNLTGCVVYRPYVQR